MTFLDLALTEPAVVMPEKELRQIVNDAEKFETLFFDLLRVCLQASGEWHSSVQIEQWIRENYLQFRPLIPRALKELYLQRVAFRGR
jgi:hypothetical protein